MMSSHRKRSPTVLDSQPVATVSTDRMEELLEEVGSPRRYLECGAHKGTGIAVLTSGGDAQGMNAALRAVVRTGLYLGCQVYFVKEGYEGLVNDEIVVAKWASISNVLNKGGTIIGSARCVQFRTRDGRLQAARNLVLRGINNLVVIGGDGSLTGAHIFRSEWTSLLQDLLRTRQVESVQGVEHLQIIGIVGSIDNDFCGTDMTIGTDTALHRILEAIDAIVCTAYSHQRTFIMEVMGRRCGYLAICAGLLSSATAVFIPEEPATNWEDDICEIIQKERDSGQRLNIIIVAEGAMDHEGQPITGDMIKEVVTTRLKQDTRVTVLGHIQRGGSPSAFDRILGARMGVEAVLAVLDSTEDTEPQVITLNGNQSIRLPLMQCVEKTQAVYRALEEKNWALAIQLRGRSFMRRLDVYKQMHSAGKAKRQTILQENPQFNLAVIHIGSPVCGMNAAVHSFVRAGIQNQWRIYGISDGLDGLVEGNIHEMKWTEVTGWVGEGGALLGTKRTLPHGKFEDIASQLNAFAIDAIFMVGGFEAYQTAIELMYERKNHPEFSIPILVAAATINNNVPGCDISLGSDTALNEIVEICDRVRMSAQGVKRRVFICETMGGYCGYLATLAGLAGGADAAYIYEETFSIKDLQRDLFNMAAKMCAGVQRGLILRNEKCSDNYDCKFMTKLYSEEGRGIFSARSNVIGHMQQGRTSSPFDRNMGLTYGLKAIQWFKEQFGKCNSGGVHTTSEESVVVLGLKGAQFALTPVSNLIPETDFMKRLPRNQWWMKLRPILRILARHETTYVDGTYMFFDEPAISAKYSTAAMHSQVKMK